MLTALTIEERGFTLTKNEFRDTIHLRYNKSLKGMPSQCLCGQNYDVTHAMNCKKGRFVIMRHNNVQNFEANLVKTTLNNFEIESRLQKIDNEELNGLIGDNARPDVRARGVWIQGQNALFDIRLTNTNFTKTFTSKCYSEKTRKRKKESL